MHALLSCAPRISNSHISKIYNLAVKHGSLFMNGNLSYSLSYSSGTARNGETPFNYYEIKDSRNATISKGFHQNDPRESWTNRDDAVDDIEDLGFRQESSFIGSNEEVRVTTNMKCKVTKSLVKVEVPVNKLNAQQVVDALFFMLPEQVPRSDVEQFYTYLYCQSNPNMCNDLVYLDIDKIRALEKHIFSLARICAFPLKQSLLIMLALDHLNMLNHDLRNALLVPIESQLYAFRPYDVAASVSIYGRIPDRYSPFLNTLGLIFYDMMIGGKTSVCPNGISLKELLDVASSFARVNYPIKKVIDPIFGMLFDRIHEMSSSQMIDALSVFFKLSRDTNFVELYTLILSVAFDHSLLFVDNFEKFAQERLEMNFEIISSSKKVHDLTVADEYTFEDLRKLFEATAVCNSEFLISSVHSRIEFKRLWSENIKTGNIPWQKPNNLREIERFSVGNDCFITYKDQLPKLYEVGASMLKASILGGLSSVSVESLTQYIVKQNSFILERASGICIANSNLQTAEKLKTSYQTYYPFVTCLRISLSLLYENNREFPTGDQREMVTIPIIERMCGANLPGSSEVKISDISAINFHVYNLLLGSNNLEMNLKDEVGDSLFSLAKVNKNAWMDEVLSGITIGNYKNMGNNKIRFVESDAIHLANCISTVNDYSRYASENSDSFKEHETLNLLGNLYFRILYVESQKMNSEGNVIASYLTELFSKICPKCLLLHSPHLPYTFSDTMDDNSEFYRENKERIVYYKPPPAISGIFRGKPSLYGLILYVVANKLQYYAFPMLTEQGDVRIFSFSEMLQDILHPLSVVARIEIDPVGVWDLIHFNGRLNERLTLLENLDLLDPLKSESINMIENMFVSPTFQRIFISFANVALSYCKSVILCLNKNNGLLPIYQKASLLKSISMLSYCVKYFGNVSGIRFDAVYTSSLPEIIRLLLSDELINNVDLNNEEGAVWQMTIVEHLKLLDAISMAIPLLSDSGDDIPAFRLLHICLQIAYRRLAYYSPEYLVPLTISLACLKKHFDAIYTETCDDLVEQISQLISILKDDAAELIHSSACGNAGATYFTESGKNCFLALVG